jgi:hypothetical protein
MFGPKATPAQSQHQLRFEGSDGEQLKPEQTPQESSSFAEFDSPSHPIQPPLKKSGMPR